MKNEVQKLSLIDIKREIYLLKLIQSKIPYYLSKDEGISISWDKLSNKHFGLDSTNKLVNLVKIIKRFETNGVIIKREQTRTQDGFVKFTVDEKSLQKLLMILEMEKNNRLDRLDLSFCSFANNNFKLKTNSDDSLDMSFSTTKGLRKTYDMFSIMFDFWQNHANKTSNSWVETSVPKDYIVAGLKKRRYKDDECSSRKISHTMRNLRKKINNSDLADVLEIPYTNQFDAYNLRVKQPDIV